MEVKDLRPANYNPRIITDKEARALKKSMDEFGDLSGVVFNVRTGNLIGGHQRAKHLDPAWTIFKEDIKDDTGTVAMGHIETPKGRWTYREVDWPQNKEVAANIAANKHGGQFDIPKLKDLLVELDTGDFNLELTGFDENELKELIDWEGEQGLTDADSVPDVPEEPITKAGDIIILGGHRILCGDATKREDVLLLMGGDKADMIFTDPPYGVSYQEKNKSINAAMNKTSNESKIMNDDLSVEETGTIFFESFSRAHEASKSGAPYYFCSPQGGELMMMMMMIEKSGWQRKHMMVWVKNHFVLGRMDYHYQHEPIFYGWKQKESHKFYGGRGQSSAWSFDKPLASKLHPTMKPVELIEKAVNNSSRDGEIVLDLFLGSGSTLIACEKTNRKCYGMELDPHYCDVIVRRWEDFTGGKAGRP